MTDFDKSIGQEQTVFPAANEPNRVFADGTVFGQYRIIRLLGRGGMGEVYEAEHTTLGRRYALKLLPVEFTSRPGALERFRREARVMAALEHPNIIRVDEFGETEGRYWLRMELAEGLRQPEVGGQRSEVSNDPASRISHPASCVTLADLAKAHGGKLSQDTLLPILGNILDGLAYAHARGAVHRDLKPSNILLAQNIAEDRGQRTEVSQSPSTINQQLATGSLTAKIADFGLVKLVGEEWVKSMVELSVQRSMSIGAEKTVVAGDDRDSKGTSTRSLFGTYEYMSPEQKRGEEADARSDIYAVGLMIYKLLTGRELGMRTPSQIDPSLDKRWDAVILQALEENPDDRFQSVSELRSQLSGISCQESGSGTANERTKRKKETVDAVPPPRSEDVNRESTLNDANKGHPVDPVILSEKIKKKPGWKWEVVSVVLILVAAGFGLSHRSKITDSPSPVKSNVGQASSLSSVQPDAQKENPSTRAKKPRFDGILVSTTTPEEGQPWMSPSTGMEFVWIEALKMWVGKYEVTNGEYRKKEPGYDSKNFNDYSLNEDRQPVVYVNFNDAQAYAKWLTEQDQQSGKLPEGYEYRLPTGDEWITFAQCGDGREYPWGNDWPPKSGQAGNYLDSTAQSKFSVFSKGVDGYTDGFAVTCPVEKSVRNDWGVLGVGGNVCEWTEEQDDDSSVLRGASWNSFLPYRSRCEFGDKRDASQQYNYIGFRLVLSRTTKQQPMPVKNTATIKPVEYSANGVDAPLNANSTSRKTSAMPLNLLTEDFSTTLAGWNVETPSRSSSVKLKDGTLEIVGKDGSNYSAEIFRDVFPGQVYSEYTLSFDWKVTVRETPNGRTGVRMNFFDRQDNLIGRMEVLDSGQTWRSQIQEHKPSNLSSSQYGGSLRNGKTFDWEHASVSTADIPGLDRSKVHRIQVQAWVHNDAGSGGDLYVDNLQLTAKF